MKYAINSKMLVDALGRCGTVSDGYVLTFTDRPVNEKGSEVYATISACTNTASSTITLIVSKSSKDATKKKINVGTDFLDAAKALSKAGETVMFTLKDNSMDLSFGDARIEVGYKDTVSEFSVKSPRQDSCARFTIETKEWKRVIQQTGFAYGAFSETSEKAGLNNILLLPCVVGEDYGIRTCSSNGYFGSSSHSIIKEMDEALIEMANNSKGVSLPPVTVKAISSVLKGDFVTVFIFDTQLMIKDGNDVFSMVLAASPFPVRLLALMDEQSQGYSVKTDISDLKIALDIVSVNCKDSNKAHAILEVNEQGATFFAKETSNKSPLKTVDATGTVEIVFCIKQLKDIISSGITEVNSVVISGKDDGSMIHVRGGHCNAFTLPVTLSTESAD